MRIPQETGEPPAKNNARRARRHRRGRGPQSTTRVPCLHPFTPANESAEPHKLARTVCGGVDCNTVSAERCPEAGRNAPP